MSELQKLDVSSKMSLKLSCLQVADGNVERAKELYDYISSDMKELPDMTPIPPTTFQQIKNSAEDVITWIQDHQNDFVNVYTTIQAMRGKVSTITASAEAANIPPLPNT